METTAVAAMSDYLENKLIDFLFRGQAYAPPATLYAALFTTNPSDNAGGVEVAGGAYARVGVAASLANFAGTQAVGSTVASSGTGGTTSNNNVITFPAPTANWGTVTGFGIFDAATGGNLLFYGALNTAQAINSGQIAPAIAAAGMSLQLDN